MHVVLFLIPFPLVKAQFVGCHRCIDREVIQYLVWFEAIPAKLTGLEAFKQTGCDLLSKLMAGMPGNSS